MTTKAITIEPQSTDTLTELSTGHWAYQLDQDDDYIMEHAGLSEAQNMDLMLIALSILD